MAAAGGGGRGGACSLGLLQLVAASVDKVVSLMLLLLVSVIPATFWIVGTDPVDEELACSRTGLSGRENSRVDRGKRKVRIHTKVGTIAVLHS